ncbi:hypothetical protein HNW77_10670 [Komagataeibacter sp. AV436]|uniref:Uncharacterized protein n=1 Tax=Komagataeibacter melomenusus TaxID=2766578 RepID=A0ABX2AEP8_9PROT|nr:hypothetical protein [Komagataeibacter melomenusus]MBV1831040.1 hypothetical protein [Komagataeibacter melomenusus]NPC66848.1 hypothetical protein [Komagataeibacter melomenusus]
MPFPSPSAAHPAPQDSSPTMPHPAPSAATPLPLTWMARAGWQRLVCMALPCGLLWGLVAWAVAQP